MRLVSLQSNNISGVAYDNLTEELHVVFQNGKIYRYHFVPAEVVTGFMFDETSQGQAFLKSVVHAGDGGYAYDEIDPLDVNLHV